MTDYMVIKFNGRPIADELRRLSMKNPGYCCEVMRIAADAISSGSQQVIIRGIPLIDALHLCIRESMGDSRAVIRLAIGVLRELAEMKGVCNG